MAQYVAAALHHDNRTDTSDLSFPSTSAKRDDTAKMLALQWQGSTSVSVNSVPRVAITDNDLHLYHNEFLGLYKGDILGHEGMGIVEAVGPDVTKFKPGDRVVVSCVISCGKCGFCREGRYGLCDCTNPSKDMEKLYGHRCAALFGYSHLLGGYEGAQAEYMRVPIADVNLFKVDAPSAELPDEKLLFLSDILCTGWHANELVAVQEGDTVVIWGCGPVGLCSAMWAKFRGASRVVVIDNERYRLNTASKCIGVDVVDRGSMDVVKTIQDLLPGGPDVCIEAAGFRFGLETDSAATLNEAITLCKKGGRISLIGDWYNMTNHFQIGAFMEKGLHMAGGQVWPQKYMPLIYGFIKNGLIDPSFLTTHLMPMSKMDDAYKMFDKHQDDVLKIVLKPDAVQPSTRKIGPCSKPAILRMPTRADYGDYAPAVESITRGSGMRGGPAHV